MSGLLARRIWPLALMKSDGLGPDHCGELEAHDDLRVVLRLSLRPCRSSRLVALAKLLKSEDASDRLSFYALANVSCRKTSPVVMTAQQILAMLAGPIMGLSASLHADAAGREPGEASPHLGPAQLAIDRSGPGERMNLEIAFAQIDPNSDQLIHRRPPRLWRSSDHVLALDAVRARPSTPSLRAIGRRKTPVLPNGLWRSNAGNAGPWIASSLRSSQ